MYNVVETSLKNSATLHKRPRNPLSAVWLLRKQPKPCSIFAYLGQLEQFFQEMGTSLLTKGKLEWGQQLQHKFDSFTYQEYDDDLA